MIAVNGVRLELSDTENIYVKEILECKKKIEKDYKFPVLLKYAPEYYIENPENPNKPEKKAGVYLRYSEKVLGKNGMPEQWEYFKTEKFLQDKSWDREPKGVVFRGWLLINEIDADLAVFLLFKSSRCKNSLSDYVNGLQTEKYFVLENKCIEAKNIIKKESAIIDVSYMVKSENSPLKEEQIRELAVSYGLPDMEKKDEKGKYELSLDEVRVSLWNYLRAEANLDRDVYNKFLHRVRSTKELEMIVLVNRLMTEKKITLRFTGKGGQTRIFSYLADDGSKGEDIHKCSPRSEKSDECIAELAAKIQKDTELMQTMKELI